MATPYRRFRQIGKNGEGDPLLGGSGGGWSTGMIVTVVILAAIGITAIIVGGIALGNTNKPVMPEMPLMLGNQPGNKRAPVTQTMLPTPRNACFVGNNVDLYAPCADRFDQLHWKNVLCLFQHVSRS